MTREPEVVCVGLATRDTIALVRVHPGSDERVEASALVRAGGGPAATAAVVIARLGHTVWFAGAVGDDEAGDEIRDGLADEGVDISQLAVVPGARSPESMVLVDEATGGRSISHYPGTAGAPEVSPGAADRFARARWIHADHAGFAAALALSGGDSRLSVDGGNPIPARDLSRIDLYVPTASALTARYPKRSLEDAMRAAIEEGAGAVVVTMGSDGARGLAADGEPFAVPGVATPVVSTLGAGDVFHGALLAALLDGRPLEEATAQANLAAAVSCAALDGRSAIPDREALRGARRRVPATIAR